MKSSNLIEEKLFGYEDFLSYCRESGKIFVEDLDRDDFIAYRAEYSVSRERVEQIKTLINFQEQNLAEKNLLRKIFPVRRTSRIILLDFLNKSFWI